MPFKPNGFPRSERLRTDADFKSVYSGKRLFGRFFVIHYKLAPENGGRALGAVVSKKVSRSAAARNRLKRRIREIYRCNKALLPERARVIVRSLPGASGAGFHEIQREIISLFAAVSAQEHRD